MGNSINRQEDILLFLNDQLLETSLSPLNHLENCFLSYNALKMYTKK